MGIAAWIALHFTSLVDGFSAVWEMLKKFKVFDRRKNPRGKGSKMELIGKLSQQVRDMRKVQKSQQIEISRMRPELTRCKIERAECEAKYRFLGANMKVALKRISALERRTV